MIISMVPQFTVFLFERNGSNMVHTAFWEFIFQATKPFHLKT